jgi:hypothetical protein
MGITKAFFQSSGIAFLFIVISSNLVRYGIMSSPNNFKITSGMPSGLTDFYLPNFVNSFPIILIPMVKGLPESVD